MPDEYRDQPEDPRPKESVPTPPDAADPLLAPEPEVDAETPSIPDEPSLPRDEQPTIDYIPPADVDAPDPALADALTDLEPPAPDADEDGESTRPKAPPGLREAILAQQAAEAGTVDLSTEAETIRDEEPAPPVSTFAFPEPPIDTTADTAEVVAIPRRRVPALMVAGVMLTTVCLCLALIAAAGFAGYRDGLATNDVRLTQSVATEIAAQYEAGLLDLEAGRYGLAMERLAWIVDTVQPPPEYLRDSRTLYAQAATLNAVTPTPDVTATPEPTSTPEQPAPDTAELNGDVLNGVQPSQTDPAYLFAQADQAFRQGDFEGAISWAESLRALAPDHRPGEVRALLGDALTRQGLIYLRGQNADGEDRLLRGILLIYRASELGPLEPPDLLYEAEFAERYLNARNYLNGGHASAAMPILQRLCEENCNWSYRGVSVRDLLAQATGTSVDQ